MQVILRQLRPWLLLLLTGCTELHYYGQAIQGQVALMQARQPLADVMYDASRPPEQRTRLHQLAMARLFAERQLALPVAGAYSSYVQLNGPAVVWNVTAAPRFSVKPVHWCYPLLGCQSYRGYFAEQAARAKAAELSASGLDTWVSGVTAYSTLGWFDDPVLSSFLRFSASDAVGLLFHELSHRRVYIRDDTRFNESYATAVELEGLQRWLMLYATAAEADRARRRIDTRHAFGQLIAAHSLTLQAFYHDSETRPDAEREQGKRRLLAALREDYSRQRHRWPEPELYDHWFKEELNNARLALAGNYLGAVAGFRQLLHEQGGDFSAFHRAVEALAALPQGERDARLVALGQRFDEHF